MFKLIPAFKDYIWGGIKLKEKYNKYCDFERIAEAWELSTHPDGLSIIENNENKTLLSYVKENGKSASGSKCKLDGELPITIKFIDAKDNLSVQVHPDDEYALKNENDFGKTEMWYIIECEPNAELIYGFNKNVTKEELEKAIAENSLETIVNRVKIKPGDVIFIEAGTIHAIGKGTLIAEIQQRSNVTYRLYDFGRIGPDGNPRELHIKKALDVLNLNKIPLDKLKVEYNFEEFNNFRKAILSECEYFKVNLLEISDEISLETDGTSFHNILVLEGAFNVSNNEENINCEKFDSIFIPANSGNYKIIGKGKIILTTL